MADKPIRGNALIAAIAFVTAYAGARLLLKMESPPAARVLIALLPLPFFAAWLWMTMKSIATLDELERRIHLEAAAISLSLSMLLFMTLGLLQIAIKLSLDDWSYRHTWIYLPLFYFAGLAIARRRYA